MSHQHFCGVAGHWWTCEGTALRAGDAEPSVCTCLPCGLPLEDFDHSECQDPVELLACPEHRSADEGRTNSFLCRGSAGQASSEEVLEVLKPDQPPPPFERFPLVPIEKGDPLWHCDLCCHCGCRRMPAALSGALCLHCFHEYQVNDPEFWLGEEFPHSQAAHWKSCPG
jgi:hypothetical protein